MLETRNFLRKAKTNITTRLNWSYPYGTNSFSQDGEDLILQKLFKKVNNGFYVDIGAHHPYRYSNTYLLYKRGWRGISIDPTPGVKILFDRTRGDDINLELAIGNKNESVKLFMFTDSAFNTLSQKRANEVIKSDQSKLIGKRTIKTKLLAKVLDKYADKKSAIELMNIDVEGKELEVLKSNDWKRFIPMVILIENTDNKNDKSVSPIEKYLSKKGYKKIDQTKLTQIYTHKTFKK